MAATNRITGKFYTIGDSLSDMGAFCQASTKWFHSHGFFWIKKVQFDEPYFQNCIFSNGPTAATLVAAKLNKTFRPGYRFTNIGGKVYEVIGENYAIGGAHAGPIRSIFDPMRFFLNHFHLQKQVKVLLKHHQLHDNDQIFCCIGGNDLLWAMKKITPMSETIVVKIAINSQFKALIKLAKAGAKHVVVANSPNLAIIPMFKKNRFWTKKANRIYQKYSQKWNVMMTKLIKLYPNVFQKYDLNSKTSIWIKEFSALNSNTDINRPALRTNYFAIPVKGKIVNYYNQSVLATTVNNHLFFDFMHPTAILHQWWADDLINYFKCEE